MSQSSVWCKTLRVDKGKTFLEGQTRDVNKMTLTGRRAGPGASLKGRKGRRKGEGRHKTPDEHGNQLKE